MWLVEAGYTPMLLDPPCIVLLSDCICLIPPRCYAACLHHSERTWSVGHWPGSILKARSPNRNPASTVRLAKPPSYPRYPKCGAQILGASGVIDRWMSTFLIGLQSVVSSGRKLERGILSVCDGWFSPSQSSFRYSHPMCRG